MRGYVWRVTYDSVFDAGSTNISKRNAVALVVLRGLDLRKAERVLGGIQETIYITGGELIGPCVYDAS